MAQALCFVSPIQITRLCTQPRHTRSAPSLRLISRCCLCITMLSGFLYCQLSSVIYSPSPESLSPLRQSAFAKPLPVFHLRLFACLSFGAFCKGACFAARSLCKAAPREPIRMDGYSCFAFDGLFVFAAIAALIGLAKLAVRVLATQTATTLASRSVQSRHQSTRFASFAWWRKVLGCGIR